MVPREWLQFIYEESLLQDDGAPGWDVMQGWQEERKKRKSLMLLRYHLVARTAAYDGTLYGPESTSGSKSPSPAADE